MKYTLGFRIWHWMFAAVILGLLGTVFLRKTFLSYKANAEILMNKLSDMGTDISIEDAKILAKTIRNNMWEWHIILGYTLAALVIYRIILFFVDKSKKESFSTLSLHKKGVKSLYYVFYVTVLFMTLSGFTIYFYEELGLAKEVAKQIKDIHEAAFNIIMVFVALHVAGVIIADVKDENGLISSMINGKQADKF